jgi:hypothetical protein
MVYWLVKQFFTGSSSANKGKRKGPVLIETTTDNTGLRVHGICKTVSPAYLSGSSVRRAIKLLHMKPYVVLQKPRKADCAARVHLFTYFVKPCLCGIWTTKFFLPMNISFTYTVT